MDGNTNRVVPGGPKDYNIYCSYVDDTQETTLQKLP